MIKLAKYLLPYSLFLLLIVLLTYGQTVANLALPDYMADIINKGIVGSKESLIYSIGWKMILVSLLGGICTIAVSYYASKVATGFAMDLRDKVFTKVENFSLIEFNKFSTASLITRTTNDIQQIQMVYVMLLRLALMAPFMGVGAIIKAYNLAPSMTWIMAVAIVCLVIIIATLFAIAIPKFTKLQKLVDRLNLVAREILTGLRVIRAFNNEKFEEKKFDNVNTDLTNLNLAVNRLMVLLQPAMMLIFNLTSIGIVWYGARQVDIGALQVGDILAFMQYAMQGIMGFLMLSIIFIMVPRASVSANRLVEVLQTEPVINDPKKPIKPKDNNGEVEFRNVAYSYTGSKEPVLKDINFKALPGETTAIIGSTGSGKSTLINLIPRFYDVTAGQILVDGVDVREMKQEDLYKLIGYIPQKASLFSGTVEDNIKYGAPDTSIDKVKQSAQIAQALDFINKLEEKFQAPISQGATNISGGQKQRLSIARAIARDPEIYLFDDSFSALDFATDAKLRSALKEVTKSKTVLIVAQRVSTIMTADKIIVLDDGRIVGIGKHDELMKTCQVYQEIATSQLSSEELKQESKIVSLNTKVA
jgi:ATP-binding cassette subfamily B protein